MTLKLGFPCLIGTVGVSSIRYFISRFQGPDDVGCKGINLTSGRRDESSTFLIGKGKIGKAGQPTWRERSMCCLRYGMVCDAMAPRLSVSTLLYSTKSHHKPSRYSERPPASFLLPVHIKRSQSYYLTPQDSIGALSRHQYRSHIERASIQVGDNTQNTEGSVARQAASVPGEACQGGHCLCVSCVQQK